MPAGDLDEVENTSEASSGPRQYIESKDVGNKPALTSIGREHSSCSKKEETITIPIKPAPGEGEIGAEGGNVASLAASSKADEGEPGGTVGPSSPVPTVGTEAGPGRGLGRASPAKGSPDEPDVIANLGGQASPSPANEGGSEDSKLTRSASETRSPPPKRAKISTSERESSGAGKTASDTGAGASQVEEKKEENADDDLDKKVLATTWSESVLIRGTEHIQSRYRVFSNSYAAGAVYVDENDKRAKRRGQDADEEIEVDAFATVAQKPAPAVIVPYLPGRNSSGNGATRSGLAAGLASTQGDVGQVGGVSAEQPTGKATPGRRRARAAGGSAQRPKSGRGGALPMLASAPLPLRMPGAEGDVGVRDARPGVQELKSWGPPGSAPQQQGQGWPMPGMDILRAIWPGPGGPGQGPPAPAPRPPLQPQGSWPSHQMQAPAGPPQGAQAPYWPQAQWQNPGALGGAHHNMLESHSSYSQGLQGFGSPPMAHRQSVAPASSPATYYGQGPPTAQQYWQPPTQPGYPGQLASWPHPMGMMTPAPGPGQFRPQALGYNTPRAWGSASHLQPQAPDAGSNVAASLLMSFLSAFAQPGVQPAAQAPELQKTVQEWGQQHPGQEGQQPIGSGPAMPAAAMRRPPGPLNSAPSAFNVPALQQPYSAPQHPYPDAASMAALGPQRGSHPMFPGRWGEAAVSGTFSASPARPGMLHSMLNPQTQFGTWGGVEAQPSEPHGSMAEIGGQGRHWPPASSHGQEQQGTWRPTPASEGQ